MSNDLVLNKEEALTMQSALVNQLDILNDTATDCIHEANLAFRDSVNFDVLRTTITDNIASIGVLTKIVTILEQQFQINIHENVFTILVNDMSRNILMETLKLEIRLHSDMLLDVDSNNMVSHHDKVQHICNISILNYRLNKLESV